MKKALIFTSFVSVFFLISSCEGDAESTEGTETEDQVESNSFSALEMPSTLANGDPFPTSESVINGWIANSNAVNGLETNPKIISHAWGLWQALTEETDQKYNGRLLRRFETWYTPQDVMRAEKQDVSLQEVAREEADLQFRPKFAFGGHSDGLSPEAGDISGKVKYNPAMAEQALAGNYFDTTTLKKKIKKGEIATLTFETNSMSLKPIYRVLTDMDKVEGKSDTWYFNIWDGPQDGGKPINEFSKLIYVTSNKNDPAIDNKTTYSIDAFIHHTMSEAEAYTYNNSTKEGQEYNDTAKVGDPIILLGMHVTSRETSLWTWQSFYWTENPDNPAFPSSATIAAGRNSLKKGRKLDAQANHYSVSIGYSMNSPGLPVDGPPVDIAKSGTTSIYSLNPYIEGTFDASVFSDQQTIFTGDYAKQFNPKNIDGLTSNCMSCHSQAAYFGNSNTTLPFVADQYVNRNAPWFKNSVQLDFAWSLFPGFEPPPLDMPKLKGKKGK